MVTQFRKHGQVATTVVGSFGYDPASINNSSFQIRIVRIVVFAERDIAVGVGFLNYVATIIVQQRSLIPVGIADDSKVCIGVVIAIVNLVTVYIKDTDEQIVIIVLNVNRAAI